MADASRSESVGLADANGRVSTGEFRWEHLAEDRVRLMVVDHAGECWGGQGESLVAALYSLRLRMEGSGQKLLILAAARYGHPAQLNSGNYYRLRMRRTAVPWRMAGWLDPVPAEDVGTAAEQEAFFDAWGASFKWDAWLVALEQWLRDLWLRLR